MKKYLYFSLLSIVIFLNACAFSKYYYNEGDYETAIGVAVSKLKNNSKNWREALVLEKAYNEAFSKDIARIEFLKKEGNRSPKPVQSGAVTPCVQKPLSGVVHNCPAPKTPVRVVSQLHAPRNPCSGWSHNCRTGDRDRRPGPAPVASLGKIQKRRRFGSTLVPYPARSQCCKIWS